MIFLHNVKHDTVLIFKYYSTRLHHRDILKIVQCCKKIRQERPEEISKDCYRLAIYNLEESVVYNNSTFIDLKYQIDSGRFLIIVLILIGGKRKTKNLTHHNYDKVLL